MFCQIQLFPQVSSQSVVVCELPLLEGIAGFTGVQAKSVALRPRLQAHVVGHKLCYKVLRLCKNKTGSVISEQDSSIFIPTELEAGWSCLKFRD